MMDKRTRRTSAETFEKIRTSGILSERRLQVYEILYREGPLTGGQVARRMQELHNVGGFSESVRNRLTELRDRGCVEEVGEAPCPVTGNRSILWDVTPDLPTEHPRTWTRPVKYFGVIVQGQTSLFPSQERHRLFLTEGAAEAYRESLKDDTAAIVTLGILR